MMEDLVAQLEGADEGHPVLDVMVAGAFNLFPDDALDDWEVPHYTTSVDVALTLLSKEWSWRLGNLASGSYFADYGTQLSLQCIEGETPALAICIVAAKARELTGGE